MDSRHPNVNPTIRSFDVFVALSSVVSVTRIMPFSTLQRDLIVEHYFRSRVKQRGISGALS
jgi:hypothetical protein